MLVKLPEASQGFVLPFVINFLYVFLHLLLKIYLQKIWVDDLA